MEADEYRKCAKELVDLIADYLETVNQRPVLPDVQPGYIRELMPAEAPEQPERWKEVLKDVEKVIMPGMTHWSSPHFHAYYPTGNSYPAICADILSSALSGVGFPSMSSPACTELEMVMMDWLGKALQLPDHFLFESKGTGGGNIQGTASEATFVALLAARSRTLRLMEKAKLENLVSYTSDQSHSSVERAGLLGPVKMRLLPTDENLGLRGETLEKAIEEDREEGKIPFFVVATLGTTSTCAFDNLREIGEICEREEIWLHVDAAYAGSAFVCPEFRHFLEGVEYADSFNFNPHKLFLVNFDCSAMWVKNQNEITETFSAIPTYSKQEKDEQIPDFKSWQTSESRRFRSLKLWFVLRMYGIEGLRRFVRTHVHLAKEFEQLVLSDERFEVIAPVHLGLVCFRKKGSNSVNEDLLKKVNARCKIHITPTIVRDRYVLRFIVCSQYATLEDVHFAWREIQLVSSEMLP